MTFNTMRLVAYKLVLASCLIGQAFAMNAAPGDGCAPGGAPIPVVPAAAPVVAAAPAVANPVAPLQPQIQQFQQRIRDLNQQIDAAVQANPQGMAALRAQRQAAEVQLDALLVLREARSMRGAEMGAALAPAVNGQLQAAVANLQQEVTNSYENIPQTAAQAAVTRANVRGASAQVLALEAPIVNAVLDGILQTIRNGHEVEMTTAQRIGDLGANAVVQQLIADSGDLTGQANALRALLTAIVARAQQAANPAGNAPANGQGQQPPAPQQ